MRIGGGLRRQQRCQSRQRERRPAIVGRWLPTGEAQAAIRRGERTNIGKGCHRIGKKHDTETRNDKVKTWVVAIGRSIGTDEIGCAKQFLGTSARPCQQRFGDIDAGGMAVVTDRPGQRQRGFTTATAYVEHIFSRLWCCQRQQCCSNRGERAVHPLLHLHPGLADLAIPIFDLFCIRHDGPYGKR